MDHVAERWGKSPIKLTKLTVHIKKYDTGILSQSENQDCNLIALKLCCEKASQQDTV